MFDHPADPYVLSSSCPCSCSLVKFALRLGGSLDPQFLLRCQITDKKFEAMLGELKPVPLNYEPFSSNYDYQEELFLDMDLLDKSKRFAQPWQFQQQYHPWMFGSSDLVI